ncbi:MULTISPECIES: hypothetical protein [unclassified Roseitalea]|uniref:hypothetical protein n=1 Tax=unclassified Roseitalea TaxID=2639107 RepID=UPI00273D1396|nr:MULTISPECIES: hypothetical protein [unclassified Roseitalea]
MATSFNASHGADDPLAGHEIVAGLPRVVWRVFWLLCVLASLTVAMLLAGHFYGNRLVLSGHTTSDEVLRIVIGEDVLHVPANMIRRPEQRDAGIAGHLDLKLHWPERSGLRPDLIDAFSNTDPETTRIVLITISERQSFLDMADRFAPVYLKALDDSVEWTFTDGLARAALDPALGYVDEWLAFGPTNEPGTPPAFIARCQDAGAGGEPLLLPCQTDLYFGDTLEARVRFAMPLLADWERFGPELEAFVESLRVRGLD